MSTSKGDKYEMHNKRMRNELCTLGQNNGIEYIQLHVSQCCRLQYHASSNHLTWT